MTLKQFLYRSLVYYRKTQVWVVLGAMMSTAILTGAFVIGDSVRNSLRKIVFDRLGDTEFALASGDRLFRTQMADDLGAYLRTPVAPLLQTRGIAIADGGEFRMNDIQIVGVDARFGEIGRAVGLYDHIERGEAIINRLLASRLGVKENDEILIRMAKLDVMPKDVPLSLDSDTSVARRFTVKSIAPDSAFGRYSLRNDQVSEGTVFVSLPFMSREMGFVDRANVLLVSGGQEKPLDTRMLNDALKKVWSLTDAGYAVIDLPGCTSAEIRSDRIFLDTPVVEISRSISQKSRPILTYFVNELRRGDRAVPYSFVSAPGAPFVPQDMEDDEIVINAWLADDLDADPGDRIRLTYFVLGLGRDLQEKHSDFRVKSIIPLQGIYADRDLMPDFPGLSGEENCRDWNPGIPIDLEKIRDKDEDYWDDFRGTPKAFLTLEAAQDMWANRFGNLTAIRFPNMEKEEVEAALLKELDPAVLGFGFRDVKREGLRASSQSVDFSQLFLGLSFFIVVASLLLTGLLFVLNTESRSRENGLLLALGFPKKTVRRMVLREGAVLVVFGSLLGGIAGMLYDGIILSALKTVWRGAVGTSALHIHIRFSSLILGVAIGAVAAFFTLWLAVKRQIKQPIAGLQRGLVSVDSIRKKKPRMSSIIGIFSLAALVLALIAADFGRSDSASAFFFLAGSLILLGGISFVNVILYRFGKKTDKVRLSLSKIGIRSNARKRTRSLTLIGILACGLFIVFTVGANRLSALKGADRRDSGTGGFALIGRSSMPVLYDLNTQRGKRFYGLRADNSNDVIFVPFRMKEGDDASCLNLNRVSTPPVLGVDPAELARRGAFAFARVTEDVDPENPWLVLDKELPDGSLPAVADLSVIVWGLGKAVGDTLDYVDERGQTFRVKLVGGLANSVFQGNLIISEDSFIRKYPSISGYNLFLIDAPRERVEEVSARLSRAFRDQGLDLVPASTRLAEFNTVQNTYLSIFLILGSFGLLLGSVGLGIVAWRNINERRGELALLRAVGFSRKSVRSILLFEFVALLAAGILVGILAAFLATLPSLLTPGTEIPYPTILIILVVVGLNGGLWTYSAVTLASKEDLIPALRKE